MKVFDVNEINEKLKSFKGWSFQNNSIEKEFMFKDFVQSLEFVNALGKDAEKMNHHPDIFIHSYNKVKISVSTHSEGGVTEKDFQLAEKIESYIK